MDNKFEVVFCVVNAGFSDSVMYAARSAGASGGTIIKGRGAASPEAEEAFQIDIQPEKEIVMIIVPKDIKDDVLRTIYNTAGLASESQGIAFSLPVERAIGLNDFSKDKKQES